MKRASIIITTLNRGMLLKTAIKSALSQTYPKTETIIVDGSSDKKTSDVLDYYKNDTVVIKDTKKSGVSAARNLGLEISTGEYVTFLDDDDCFHPKKIERQLEILDRRKNVDIIFCPVGVKVKNYLIYKPFREGKENWIRLTPQNDMIMTPLVRTECFSVCGKFDESLKYHEDRDIWYRMHKKFRFAFHNNPDYIFYNNNISRLSSDVENICQGKIRLYEKHKNDFENKKSYYSDLHYELAHDYLIRGSYKDFVVHFKQSIQKNPNLINKYLKEYPKLLLGRFQFENRRIKIDKSLMKLLFEINQESTHLSIKNITIK
jgi:glycosyltransferase involved in cell wall biosynthesis